MRFDGPLLHAFGAGECELHFSDSQAFASSRGSNLEWVFGFTTLAGFMLIILFGTFFSRSCEKIRSLEIGSVDWLTMREHMWKALARSLSQHVPYRSNPEKSAA